MSMNFLGPRRSPNGCGNITWRLSGSGKSGTAYERIGRVADARMHPPGGASTHRSHRSLGPIGPIGPMGRDSAPGSDPQEIAGSVGQAFSRHFVPGYDRSVPTGRRYRQPDSHRRSFAEFTFHVDFAAVQIDAALSDHETKTRPRAATDVLRTMEGCEEPLSIGFWNADTLVSDSADDFCFETPKFETYRSADVRILDR